GYGEVKIGINLMWNALGPLIELIGPARAKRMVMSGSLFDAETLERWGLIDEIVPAGSEHARALALAAEYAALPGADFAEALAAFREKRPGNFTGN
nr:enoyl-CoA hydratase-related protein [Sandarakinorhabdus sp.]